MDTPLIIENEFLDEYLINNLVDFDEDTFYADFQRMVSFVKENFPFGFAKTEKAKATPRVRFEAISVGVALALREKPDLRICERSIIKRIKLCKTH